MRTKASLQAAEARIKALGGSGVPAPPPESKDCTVIPPDLKERSAEANLQSKVADLKELIFVIYKCSAEAFVA